MISINELVDIVVEDRRQEDRQTLRSDEAAGRQRSQQRQHSFARSLKVGADHFFGRGTDNHLSLDCR